MERLEKIESIERMIHSPFFLFFGMIIPAIFIIITFRFTIKEIIIGLLLAIPIIISLIYMFKPFGPIYETSFYIPFTPRILLAVYISRVGYFTSLPYLINYIRNRI